MTPSEVPTSRAWPTPRFTVYDVTCALTAPWLALMISGTDVLASLWVTSAPYAAVATVATLALFARFGIGSELSEYFSVHDALQITKASLGAAALTAAVVIVAVPQHSLSASVPTSHFLLLIWFLIAGRAVTRLAIRKGEPARAAREVRNVVLVGTDDTAWFFVRALATLGNAHQQIVAILDVDSSKAGRRLSGHRIIGPYTIASDLLVEMAVHGVTVDRFVVTTTAAAPGTAHWAELLRICAKWGIGLDFLPEQLNLIAPSAAGSHSWVFSGDVVLSNRRCYWRLKRGIDIAVSLVALVLLWPLFLIVGLLVAASFGPPLVFWQERLGQHARPIRIHKFRTMRAPFDRTGHRLLDNERETPVGRFLRASRFDELPQIVDILRGDMSLIGPRPLLPIDQPAEAHRRLLAPPGLTGWAQVHGGKRISADEKGVLDVWYIENASFWLDFKILLLTARAVLVGDVKTARRTENSVVSPSLKGAPDRIMPWVLSVRAGSDPNS